MSQQFAPGMMLLGKSNEVVTFKSIDERLNVAFVTTRKQGAPEPRRENVWDLDIARARLASGDYRVVLDQTAVMA